jgi:hypothetical protein
MQPVQLTDLDFSGSSISQIAALRAVQLPKKVDFLPVQSSLKSTVPVVQFTGPWRQAALAALAPTWRHPPTDCAAAAATVCRRQYPGGEGVRAPCELLCDFQLVTKQTTRMTAAAVLGTVSTRHHHRLSETHCLFTGTWQISTTRLDAHFACATCSLLGGCANHEKTVLTTTHALPGV